MPRKVAIYNQKGGVGKTMLAANLAVALSRPPLNRRVLAIDMDRQGNLGPLLGRGRDDPPPKTTTDLLLGAPLTEVVIERSPTLHFVVANKTLSDLELSLQTTTRREEVVSRQLASELDDYDYVIVDCPPSAGLLAVNACVFADELVVPIRVSDKQSVDGLGDLFDFLDELADADWDRPITAVLRTDFDSRERLHRQLNEAVEGLDHLPLYDKILKRRALVTHAGGLGQPFVEVKPDADVSITMGDFARDLDQMAVAA